MKKFLKILAGIVVFLILIALVIWFGFLRPEPPPISDQDRARTELMPLPAQMSYGASSLVIPREWPIRFTTLKTGRLEAAVDRFFNRVHKQTSINISTKEGSLLTIDCSKQAATYPQLHEDESYTLEVRPHHIVLTAPGERGILHGLETLWQLVAQENNQWIIPTVSIRDHPRFAWRGLMIDVGRHWMPKEVILRNLDAMASVKLNVLHLHLSEYQGFRVESKQFPLLQEMGSEGQYYSREDIREMVGYAADRGIRIIPEIDLPGHSTSILVGYSYLGSAPGPYVLDSLIGILDPVLDPSRDTVYQFLDELVAEMAGLFPDSVFHIGGDEVNPKAWEANPAIQRFVEQEGLNDTHGLQAYFNRRLQSILANHGKRMMGWDEILHPDLPATSIIIQPWRDQRALWSAARQGYDGVLSAGYYLDYKQPAGKHYQVDPEVIPGAVNIDIDTS
ncbi:MAG: family 20 glycosylhydrolase, partial [Saprospiraceae bacterium]|nr:family 20 glycosylhydrolase [Saprospiraceae bacterium]